MSPHEQLVEFSKAAPPVAVTSMSMAGYPLSDWVLTLTAIYTLLQIFVVVRRFIVSRRVTDEVTETDPPCTKECEILRRRK